MANQCGAVFTGAPSSRRLHRTQTLVRLLAWCLWSLGFTGGYRDGWGKSEGYADGKRLLLEGDE